MHRAASFWLSIALAGALANPARASAATPAARRCADLVSKLDSAGQLSGTLLVARGDTVSFERSFGCANYSLNVRNTPETRHCVASITKIMTDVLLLTLEEKGVVHGSDRLSRYVPDFPRADSITVDQLYHHQAGIPHRVTTLEDEVAPQSAASMVELAKKKPLQFDPGSKSSYSTAGYAVLARVLELASGRSYGALLKEIVFDPARMQNSLEPEPMKLIDRASQAYTVGLGDRWPSTARDMTYLIGGGSVYSTAGDLLRFFNAIRTGVYGPRVQAELLPGSVSWNGISSGFQSFIEYDAKSGFVTVLCGNVVTGANEMLRHDMNRLWAGEAVDPPPVFPRPIRLTPAQQAEYAGNYRVSFNNTVAPVKIAGDYLTFNETLLVPMAADTLFTLRDYGRLVALRRPDHSLEKLEWRSGGKVQVTLEKVP